MVKSNKSGKNKWTKVQEIKNSGFNGVGRLGEGREKCRWGRQLQWDKKYLGLKL